MAIFTKNPLDSTQIEKIMKDTGCRKSEAIARAKTAVRNGLSIDYFMEQQLYRLSDRELSKYLKKPNARKYVEALTGTKGATDFEIYQQMIRAKSDYGISFANFAKRKLLNASDERLKKAQAVSREKSAKAVSMIADSLDVSNDEAQAIVDNIRSKFGYSARDIYINRLYSMNEKEIFAFKVHGYDHRKEVISEVCKKTGWTESKVRAHMSKCNIDYGIDTAVYYCCRCYEMSDHQLMQCGNMADSRRMSGRYNKGHAKILYDKDLFNETYKDYIGRKFWVNRDTSFNEFRLFAEGLDQLFCKPIDSSIGRGTFKYDMTANTLEEAYDYFMSQPKYLIEECVTQHPEMAKFYPGSLNTVRLFTVLHNGQFDAFASFVRFGVEGVIDNFSSGGIACAVDPKTGVIITKASNKEGDVLDAHPVSGFEFEGFQIPHWDKVLERAESALRAVDGVNYVGWDVAIRDDDVVFIEGNSAPDLGVQQAMFSYLGQYIRPEYYKYVVPDAYDDMLDKVIDAVEGLGCSEGQARTRLVAAYDSELDYEFVKSQELCRMTAPQIKRYATSEETRELVDRVANENDVSVAEAFIQMRHAEKEFDVPFDVFASEGLFGADDQKLGQFALD